MWLQHGQLQQLITFKIGSPKLDRLYNSIAENYAPRNAWVYFAELAKSPVLSSIVVGGFLLFAFFFTERLDIVFQSLAALIPPLACIWFADAMGNLTGIALGLARPRITEKTPAIMVAIGGWVALVSIVVAVTYQIV